MSAPLLPAFERWRAAGRRRRDLRRAWAALHPSRLLVVSFAGLIGTGTLGFRLLPGLTAEGVALGWVDALFMATSAVCVTGLTVVDTSADLTVAGQLWILLLMQLGGLGLLTFASGILLSVGRRLSLRHEALVRGATDAVPQVDYRLLLRRVLAYTLGVELLGFVLLWVAWADRLGVVGAMWPALFHAVSAFCNAGFSIFGTGMMEERSAGFPMLIVMALVLLGAIGFLTLDEVGERTRAGWRRRQRLSLHTRFVIVATLVAAAAGALAFLLFEWERTLAGLPLRERLLNALFAGFASRTAGFATVDYTAVDTPTALVTTVLMFVGGAPGSTAGGIKVTTIAVLVVLAVARLRGRRNVSAFHRTIPDETLGRATGLAVLAGMVLVAGLFAVVAIEGEGASHGRFLPYMFEVVSAFSTTGLSMDLTRDLSPPGRVVLALLMFVGRIGVMTTAASLALGSRAIPFRYAKEDVAIG